MVMLQMMWQPSLLKSLKRKHGAPPLGLRNLGNTCYLNSVLQCLTYTPPLANFCLRFLHSSICDFGIAREKKGECPFCILEKRISRSLSSELVLDAPAKMNSCLRIYAEHFRSGRQEDAHEFLRYVIDACHNTCLRLKKLQQQRRGKSGIANGGDYSGTGETVVKEIFGGELQSQVKCLACGVESNKVDEIMDISLDILHSGSLREAFQKFFEPEILDGNNKYKCDNCKELVAARKQLSIIQAPNVLVIQLKRFEGMLGGKVDKLIHFDETLELASHMSRGNQDQYPEYNLFGTIVHSGFSPDSGHYYAYIKDTIGRWYCCNDSDVSGSTLQEVLSEKAYILFFSRTKQRPQTIVNTIVNGSKAHASNGRKISVTQKSDCPEKPVFSKHVLNRQPEIQNSTNGSRPCIHKSGCLEKPVDKKLSAESSNLVNPHVTNGTKVLANKRSDCLETPCTKDSSHNYSGSANSMASSVSSPIYSTGGNGYTSVEPVDFKEAFNHHSQTNNASKSKAEQELSSQQKTKLCGSVILEIAGNKNDFKEENGCPAPVTSAIKALNAKGELNCLEGSDGETAPIKEKGSIGVESSGRSSSDVTVSNGVTVAQKSGQYENSMNADMGSSNNLCMKRKLEDDQPCIFLARDNQSCAEVEAFKESIGKEASTILHDCGWSSEVYRFMQARKKLCQGADSAASNDYEKKSLLVSQAKRNFISKIPEKLKATLIERLRLFSQEKQSSRS